MLWLLSVITKPKKERKTEHINQLRETENKEQQSTQRQSYGRLFWRTGFLIVLSLSKLLNTNTVDVYLRWL